MDFGDSIQILFALIFLTFGVDFHTAMASPQYQGAKRVSIALFMICYTAACVLLGTA